MPKAILEFDTVEDRLEYFQALESYKAFRVIESIQTYLRKRYKYQEPKSDAHYEEYESIRDEVSKIVCESGISDECFK